MKQQVMYSISLIVLCGSLFFLIGSKLGIDAACTVCQEGWIYYGRSCYIKFTERGYTWLQAYQTCESLDSQMLTLSSQGETDFANTLIRNTFPNYEGTHKRVWLGCQKINNTVVCHGQASGNLELRDTSLISCIALAPFDSKTTVLRSCVRKNFVVCEKLGNMVVSRCTAVTTPYCLIGHAYSVTPVTHPIQCCMACYKDPKCRSFNLSGAMCQLNDVTMSQVRNDNLSLSIAEESCMYYEIWE